MFIKSKDVVIEQLSLEEQLKDGLNITVINPESNSAMYGIDTHGYDSPMVVITPTPEFVPDVGYDEYTFGYSYYYPALGGVNCHSDNWDIVKEVCKDTTASGRSWKQNMYRAVAVHYDLLNDLPFGTLIEVVFPEEVKGWYEVIDICPGCVPNDLSEYYFIDFLDDKQRLGWGEEVRIHVKKSD